MVYTKTDWLETAMSTAEKLTALDNLEGMYSELTGYIDAITHAGDYYTDAEAAAKFFTSSTDGIGSGLVCATLDGQTADQIVYAGSPQGAIAIWSGSVAGIPAGWVLCNGFNSTPDLRSKFVVGAGGTYAAGTAGGSATATPAASAVTIETFALTGTHLPAHTHSYIDEYRVSSTCTSGANAPGGNEDHASTTTAATSTAHGHAGSSFTGSACDILPEYWALCFIMKS